MFSGGASLIRTGDLRIMIPKAQTPANTLKPAWTLALEAIASP
jgi:hypothetical protein